MFRAKHYETGIIIVDKKGDLNIYKERGENADCCGPSKGKSEKNAAESSCCGSSDSCCSTSNESKQSNVSKKEMAGRVKDIDFNEWVGKYMYCPLFYVRT